MTAVTPLKNTPISNTDFLNDVLSGLGKTQKTLPCRWLYDPVGSELFEQITRLPEYYLTRTETAILTDAATELAAMMGPKATLVEYGAGASIKTRLLLDAVESLGAYFPVDVSEAFLLQTAEQLRTDYPGLTITPIVSDFLSDLDLPQDDGGSYVGFFPGSTIGNLSDTEIQHFLSQAGQSLGPRSALILGYDRVKPLSTLLPAYDDAQGVTAAFNLNLLRRINRELGATFDLEQFAHEARWNDAFSRVEMHLISQCRQTVTIGEKDIQFASGESIHTENSRKFTPSQMHQLAEAAGYTIETVYSDPDDMFSVAVLRFS